MRGLAPPWLSAGGGLRLGYHARRGVDDVGRCRQLEHGPGRFAGDDVPADGLQRAPGRLAGNPGVLGDDTLAARGAGIRRGAACERVLARTTYTNPYVLLSDGGHFENLGLYEMVLRRCRFIVLSDAGCDGAYCYGDLANAVRKIRIDFGVAIDFPDGSISPRRTRQRRIGGPTLRFAVGTIRYRRSIPAWTTASWLSQTDIVGDEPVDVANYARTHAAFPHESTAEQWFDEAQFESYRMLGLQTVTTLCAGKRFDSVRDLCRAVRQGHL